MPKSEDLTAEPIPSTELMGDVTELDDGSAIIEDLDDGKEVDEDFYSNLAESLDTFELNTISTALLELIEKDKEARKERDLQQEEGIRRTGLGDDAPGGATFDGAAKVVHPVLAEGCVDFSARAIKELFPSNGPVRTKIQGETTEAKLEKARKKRDFLNFYLVERMPEYRSEKEVLLTQLPLGGSQYEKYWFDGRRVRMEFVPVDKVYLPYAANSFYTSNRVTHEKDLTEEKIDELVESGFYKDVFGIADTQIERTASQEATDKIEGKEDSGYNEDGCRIIYEVTCNWDVEGNGSAPYVIHIDEPSGDICAIYRNWKESDESQERLDWWVEDKFIPWRGAYGIGFPHLIGGLAAALTGALRALLDSAHINNAPTAIKLKGGRSSGQNVSLDMTAVTEIEAPAGTDDIRKIMMPVPFNPPSAVLFQLLDWITNQAKGVVATAEERIADAGANMPVGTALALIEQGSQVFSSIHARLHDAQRKALKIICRLIADYPEHALADLGKFDLVPEDFLDSSDIAPVSDPNIFSETQRFAQMQSVMQLASADVQDPSVPWNKIALRRRMLELLRVEGIDELLPKPDELVTADPVTENISIMQGKMLKAVEPQDHLAHIKCHLMFILQPMIAQGQVEVQKLAALMSHINDHLILDYGYAAQSAQMIVMLESQGQDISPDQMALQASMKAQEANSKTMEGLLPIIAEASKIVQSKQPPPQVDPAIQKTFEAAMAEIERKKAVDQSTQQLKMQELQLDQQQKQAEAQQKQKEFGMQPMLDAMQREFEAKLEIERMQREDQQKQFSEMMANQRNDADNAQHQMTELMKNRDDNETALRLKMIELQNQVANIPSALPEPPDFSPMFKQMQDMLGQIEKAKTGDALTATVDGLRAVMAHMNAPTEFIKDPHTGETVGVRKTQVITNNGT